MKQTFITFIHNPRRVIIISATLALIIGTYGYYTINAKPALVFARVAPGIISGSDTQGAGNVSLGFLSSGRVKTVEVKVGDHVTKGQELAALDSGTARGALLSAQASYTQAKANYQKVINGAAGPTIDVAKAALHTAEVNLSEAKTQQGILVDNAYQTLLNSNPEAVPYNATTDYVTPIISGTYLLGKEGTIDLAVYQSMAGQSFTATGLTKGSSTVNTTAPTAIGDSGLYIKFPAGSTLIDHWIITIPNKKASNYLANYNAYQNALKAQNQVVGSLQAVYDQAQAGLAALVAQARPEDIAAADAQVQAQAGALETAQALYNNTIIIAPYAGTIAAVSISPGQIALPNASAVELSFDGTSQTVPMLIPKNALIVRDGKNFVLKKNGASTVETEVVIGIIDTNKVEIRSGLSVGDEVVIY